MRLGEETKVHEMVFVFFRLGLFFSLSFLLGLAHAYADTNGTFADEQMIEAEFLERYQYELNSYATRKSSEQKTDPKFVTFLEDIKGRLVLEQMHDSAVADMLISIRNDSMWSCNNLLRNKMISLLNRAGSYARRHGDEKQVKVVDDMVHEAFALWPAGPDKSSIVAIMNDIKNYNEKQVQDAQKALEKELLEKAKEAEKIQKTILAAEKKADEALLKEREQKEKATKSRVGRKTKKSDEEKITKTIKSGPLDKPARTRKKVQKDEPVVEHVVVDDSLQFKAPEDLPLIGIPEEERSSTETVQDVVAFQNNMKKMPTRMNA